MSGEISFIPVEEQHISLLQRWLKEPHVAEFWQETENEAAFREKYLHQLPARGISAFIILWAERPIGFIQSYEACQVGEGWWKDEAPGVFGIDQFIGEVAMINRGIGTKVIRAFTEKLFRTLAVSEVITDPDPKNGRAIRVYEKAGFIRHGEIKTPGGDAMLMRLSRPEPSH